MSTSATIAVQKQNGRYKIIRVNFDGHPYTILPALQLMTDDELLSFTELRGLTTEGPDPYEADRAIPGPQNVTKDEIRRTEDYLYMRDEIGVWKVVN